MSVLSLKNKSNREIDELLGLHNHRLCSDNTEYDPKVFYTDGLTSADALYTDYQDLIAIYELLIEKKVKTFCDLGAGVGRAKLLFDYLQAPFKSYSIEFVKERHQEGLNAHKNLKLPFSEGFINADLTTQAPPKCDCYFIYLPVGDVLIKTLSFLEKMFGDASCTIVAIESHGDLLSFLESTHPFLKEKFQIPLKAKRHHSDMIVYEWGPTKKYQDKRQKALQQIHANQGPLEIKWQDKFFFWMLWKELRADDDFQLLIEDENGEWLADIKDSNFGIQEATVQTTTPYRIIPLSQIKAIIRPPEDWNKIIEERRAQRRGPLGEMRKLFVSPFPQVEYSQGQKKELEEAWQWERFTTLII